MVKRRRVLRERIKGEGKSPSLRKRKNPKNMKSKWCRHKENAFSSKLEF